jgi:GDP-L-fucose synthase
MINEQNVLVTGGNGMVGKALQKLMPNAIFVNSSMYDLRDLYRCESMFNKFHPEYVIHLAARVGGIKANKEKLADFYADNIYINTNVLLCSMAYDVKKVISVLSTCVYPNQVNYPLTEDQLHNGMPHSSNYAYAIAKRGLDTYSQALRDQYGCNFVTIIPNNLYGEYDNFHLEDSHVLPAMIRKFYEANLEGKNFVELWGDGNPLREFTYSHDMAKIILFLLEKYDDRFPINIGNTNEISIKNVAKKIKKLLNYKGKIKWDTSQPNGQLRKPSSNQKLLDLGWKKEDYTDFDEGLRNVCEWFKESYPNIRGIR